MSTRSRSDTAAEGVEKVGTFKFDQFTVSTEILSQLSSVYDNCCILMGSSCVMFRIIV